MPDQPSDFTRRMLALMQRPKPDGGVWSDRGVSHAAAALGHELSATYVRELRTGIRANPSIDVVRALADVFGVQPAYFYEETDSETDEVVRAMEVLRAAGAEAVLARGEGHFTPRALRMIADAIGDQAHKGSKSAPHP